MREALIVSTARTPIGKAYRGTFNNTNAPTLAGWAIKEAVKRAEVNPDEIYNAYEESQANKLKHAQRLRGVVRAYRELGMDEADMLDSLTKGGVFTKSLAELGRRPILLYRPFPVERHHPGPRARGEAAAPTLRRRRLIPLSSSGRPPGPPPCRARRHPHLGPRATPDVTFSSVWEPGGPKRYLSLIHI